MSDLERAYDELDRREEAHEESMADAARAFATTTYRIQAQAEHVMRPFLEQVALLNNPPSLVVRRHDTLNPLGEQ